MIHVTDYASFTLWHETAHGSAYRTPSFDSVVRDMKFIERRFDNEKNVFFYFTGQFHSTPDVRVDVNWAGVAERYDNMYSDFSRYGTN